MYPAVISLFLLGITMMLASMLPSFGSYHDEAMSLSLARNFSAYRDAVADWIGRNPDADTVRESELRLPEGYRSLTRWRTEHIGNSFYVHGSPDHEVNLSELIRLSGDRSGRNMSGRLRPSGIPLPSTIPDGAVVGIIRTTNEQEP